MNTALLSAWMSGLRGRLQPNRGKVPLQTLRWFSQDCAQRNFDMVVVGGGIVGLATARELLQRHAGIRIAVLDKEEVVGYHQTGHNS
jgi:hypothetical protein